MTPHLSSYREAGNLLFVSGQLPVTFSRQVVGDDIDQQTRHALTNLENVLVGQGLQLEDIVKTTVWLTRTADFEAFNKAYAEFFPHPAPARSTLRSDLVVPGALIEIEAVALRRSKKRGLQLRKPGTAKSRSSLRLIVTGASLFRTTCNALRTLFAGLALQLPASAADAHISPAAKSYLDQAITTVQKKAYRSKAVDWPVLRAKVYAEAEGSEVPADTYQAVRVLLEGLGDHHSFLQLPDELQKLEMKRRQDRGLGPLPERQLKKSESRLFWRRNASLDFFDVNDRLAARVIFPVAFREQQTRTLIPRVRYMLNGAASSCGFIVDLRGNGGGNTWPMAMALYPLLGPGVFGGTQTADGRRINWVLDQDFAGLQEPGKPVDRVSETSIKSPDLTGQPVAVLLDDAVGSSGEAMAVAFIGRPRTLSFGQSTSGASTSNEGFPLPDGANMVVTIGSFVDRNGRVYPSGIEPDERVESTSDGVVDFDPVLKAVLNPFSDPVVSRALRWLEAQPECAALEAPAESKQ